MELKSKEDLEKLISDMQGQIENLTETVDKLSPVEEEGEEEEEKPGSDSTNEEPSEEDLDEIDKILQG